MAEANKHKVNIHEEARMYKAAKEKLEGELALVVMQRDSYGLAMQENVALRLERDAAVKERDELKQELSNKELSLMSAVKDHSEDWRRIQDAERKLDHALESVKMAYETLKHFGHNSACSFNIGYGPLDLPEECDCMLAELKARHGELK